MPLPSAISSFNCNPFIGVGVTDFFDIGITLPIAMDMVGKFADAGIGDLRITSKLSAHASDQLPLFDAGIIGAVSFATGSATQGYFPRHSYFFDKDSIALDSPRYVPNAHFTSKKSDFETHALLTLDLRALKRRIPVAFQADCGMHFTTFATNDDALLLGGAIEWYPFRFLGLFTEFNSEMRLHNVAHGFSMNKDPLHITPGMVIAPPNGVTITMGGEFSFASPGLTYSYIKERDAPQRVVTGIEPKWRIFAQIGWSGVCIDRDRDRDAIVDRIDNCPAAPEDVDGFQDDDGCPDYDNDADGIPDTLDKCPKVIEDRDGFQDTDGCPEADNDADGIADSLDTCPNVAEDHDGFQSKDGCPDYDNDADMVADSADRCPDIPEDIDGFEDADGCPDPDNDQDGVPDSLDKCIDRAGTVKNGGCPGPASESGSKEIKHGRVILRDVAFEGRTARITPMGHSVLDKVAASLVEWPDIRIEIQGHTGEAGSGKDNLELSQRRAEAVRDYLIGKGIDPQRLSATGKGDADPIADDATPQGRALNTRIEIRRTDP